MNLFNISFDLRRLLDLWVVLTFFKLLLFHSYKSTDFEVHRNWMALTYELPLKDWYFEKTSIWTLDYPPFFAYFEYLLSLPAAYFDRDMVKVNNLYYSEKSVVFYQRATVILSDLFFLYGCIKYFRVQGKTDMVRLVFSYASAAFMILDNIHFQYNSMMYGLLLVSLAYIKEGAYFKSALVYAVLLNFKHIFLYFAPCFGIIYLKEAVFKHQSLCRRLFSFIGLALQTIIVFALSFGPFIYAGYQEGEKEGVIKQLAQIGSRLFPFTRGLVHHYWAANAWAGYVFYNKYLVNIYNYINNQSKELSCVFEVDQAHTLDEYKQWTLIATLAFLLPLILSMFKHLNKHTFCFYLAATNFIVFNFGFHVHEKAILMTVIPLTLDTHSHSTVWQKTRLLLLKTVAVWTLLPLLIDPKETLVKHMILVIDTILTMKVYLKLEFGKSWVLKGIVTIVLGLICMIQVWQVVYVQMIKHMHEGWMHRYQDMVPTVAMAVNQIIFLEMMYVGIVRPKSITQEAKWKRD